MSLSTNTTKLNELKNKANNLPDQNPPAQLQEKTVTPTKEGLNVVPDSGFDGMSKVTVNGDSNLVPENIKEGVNIFGVDGTHSGGSSVYNIKKITSWPMQTKSRAVPPGSFECNIYINDKLVYTVAYDGGYITNTFDCDFTFDLSKDRIALQPQPNGSELALWFDFRIDGDTMYINAFK